ncbi:hypothetical protein [Pseudomonas fluorescens]|uniref:hypothetical protein n=1 Tax=Pseudomonas fluorescens TaxID=294 RepID=UPI002B1D1A30|nr:hypothetical protein [Pseudomonas fluorescens]
MSDQSVSSNSKTDPEVASWTTVYLRSSTEGFSSELRLRFQKVGTQVSVQTETYKIDKGGNQGGNKANINLNVKGNAGGEKQLNSDDNLYQDGVSRPYQKHFTIDVRNSSSLSMSALTIFDKSGGGDPRSTAFATFPI